jgi:hypothetical protein
MDIMTPIVSEEKYGLRAKIGVAYQRVRREIQNPEFLPTQVRFSTEQSTLAIAEKAVVFSYRTRRSEKYLAARGVENHTCRCF